MPHVLVKRVAVPGLAFLLLLSLCSAAWPAEEAVTVNMTGLSLDGKVIVTKADGTMETLKDLSKPIALPATIEMAADKGTFWISLPTGFRGKYDTIVWTNCRGEAVRVSLLEKKNGVRFEYLRGTRKFVVYLGNSENVLLVSAVAGTTSMVVSQNRVTIPEKSVAQVTHPLNLAASSVDQSRLWGDEKVIDIPGTTPAIVYFASRVSATDPYDRASGGPGWPLSLMMNPGQVSELEFQYSPKDKDILVVQVVSQAGSVEVTRAGRTISAAAGGPAIERPIDITPSPERLAVPVPEPETIEQSPYVP